MTILIKNARIIDPRSSFNNTVQYIFIEKGVITQVGQGLAVNGEKVIEGKSLSVSQGWVDIFSNFCDPGYEFKETLDSGARAAAAGGFTDVFVIPNTRPATDNKSQVEYIRRSSAALEANIHPLGAVSRNTEGKDLAEMYDMRNSGAAAFSDGINPVQSSGILLKALQYIKAFNGVIIQIPDDKTVGTNGLMHEGIVSTQLGLAGKPIMAEELLVARDIKLVRYTESAIHFTGVTSPRSLEYIRRAKDAGLNVTCSVAPYHLYFTDEDLRGYDTNLKVYPPLRGAGEQAALKAAIKDGTIDCIATHHMPEDYDNKVLEFEYAKNGMIGLETCYASLRSAMPEIADEKWVELLCINPRKIFGLPEFTLAKDAPAVLTIFSPETETTVNEGFFYSKSRNSAYLGKQLKGGVIGTIRGENVFIRK